MRTGHQALDPDGGAHRLPGGFLVSNDLDSSVAMLELSRIGGPGRSVTHREDAKELDSVQRIVSTRPRWKQIGIALRPSSRRKRYTQRPCPRPCPKGVAAGTRI